LIEEARTCPVCERPVVRKHNAGRSPLYDRITCRRAAERKRLRELCAVRDFARKEWPFGQFG
jgi:hypothetical protein